MPRPQYPSDRRRLKPHAKIHVSISNHPRTSALWGDLELRAMLVELYRLGIEKYAARTHDQVHLSQADIRSITGRERHYLGAKRLFELCRQAGFGWICECSTMPPRGDHDLVTGSSPTSCRCRAVVVTIPNFAKKQGIAPQLRSPQNAESRVQSKEEVVGSTTSESSTVASSPARSPTGKRPSRKSKRLPEEFTPLVLGLYQRLAREPAAELVLSDVRRYMPEADLSPRAVMAWHRSVYSRMREAGVTERGHARAATNWWRRIRAAELRAAIAKADEESYQVQRQRSAETAVRDATEQEADEWLQGATT